MERRSRRSIDRSAHAHHVVECTATRRHHPRGVHRLRHHPTGREVERRHHTRNCVAHSVYVACLDSGSDVIFVLGPEPSLRWRLFTEQVISVAAHFEAAMVITLGALLADVPHTKPIQLIGTASDPAVIDRFDLQKSQYEGPTGIIGVLQDACHHADVPAASLWAAVPAYASQIPSPKAAAALIERACEIIGTPAPVAALSEAIDTYEARVDELVSEDEDLAEYVERLDTMGDNVFEEDDRQMTLDFDEDEDDGSSLVDEVEQFLRDQDGR